MAIIDALLPEYDHEMGTTRRVLERVPDADFAWKPHDKSMSIGDLSTHLSNLPLWCSLTLDAPSFDLDSLGDATRAKVPATRAALLEIFDKKVADARERLARTSDPEFMAPWTLKKGGQNLFTMPRISAIRSFVMNHSIHHRGQLSVYLRLNNVPVPPIYGPTADEQA